MNKFLLTCLAVSVVTATGLADAQNRGNGGGSGAPIAGRGDSRGSGPGGGMYSGGGSGSRGGYTTGSAYRGGSSGGNRGGYTGNGNGYRGGYAGNYRGGYSHGAYRGGYGYRGGYYPYWRGAYWGPSVGFYFGAPAYWGYGYGYPSYAPAYASSYADPSFYSSPVVVEENNIYVEPQPRAAAANYWYYCTDPAGYYPYVQNCSKAWVPVVPQSMSPPAN